MRPQGPGIWNLPEAAGTPGGPGWPLHLRTPPGSGRTDPGTHTGSGNERPRRQEVGRPRGRPLEPPEGFRLLVHSVGYSPTGYLPRHSKGSERRNRETPEGVDVRPARIDSSPGGASTAVL